jgi:hypothetical protein
MELVLTADDGCKGAQFTAAEKGDEGMALKILTRAEGIPHRK